MELFIKNYCGEWTNDSGNRIEIIYKNKKSVLVTFYNSGECQPMLRPWCGNKPAISMAGTLDSESHSTLDIDLSNKENSFQFNLSLDITDSSYKSCIPSIMHIENETFLEQYYNLFGSLSTYKRC